MKYDEIAHKVFIDQGTELINMSQNIDVSFNDIVNVISSCKGKVIISGMGKSGLVGKKIAATLSSTGTSSFFLHPGEAFHGDLGMIQKNDIVILISNSGETDEILKLIPFLKDQKNILIAMTGSFNSSLAKSSNYILNINVEREVCPLNLAPTTSTTGCMVMGDALAIALMKSKSFQEQDFARFHPGGSLGKRILSKVSDVMHKENLPLVHPNDNSIVTLRKINNRLLGIGIVFDQNKVFGVITDGDLRRAMLENKEDFFELKAKNLMNQNPVFIEENEGLVRAFDFMNDKKISTLLVNNANNELTGLLKSYDIS